MTGDSSTADNGLMAARSSTAAGGSMGQAGEFGFLAALLPLLSGRPAGAPELTAAVLVPAGDDAAELEAPGGTVLASTDVLVEGRHFRREWTDAFLLGRKVAAVNLADIMAMGGRPTALLVGLAAPADLAVEWALELGRGLHAEAVAAGAALVGGDTVATDGPIVVSVTVLGCSVSGRVVLRSGATSGDVVALGVGPAGLGASAAGLALLQAHGRAAAELPGCASAVAAHLLPRPPYELGPLAAQAGAGAMCDVSDGLLADVGHLARASGVVVELQSALLAPGPVLLAAAAGLGLAPGPAREAAQSWVFTGGEDHALVACFRAAAKLPSGFTVIGRVVAPGAPGGGGPGVADGTGWAGGAVLLDGQPWIGRAGHDHFHG